MPTFVRRVPSEAELAALQPKKVKQKLTRKQREKQRRRRERARRRREQEAEGPALANMLTAVLRAATSTANMELPDAPPDDQLQPTEARRFEEAEAADQADQDPPQPDEEAPDERTSSQKRLAERMDFLRELGQWRKAQHREPAAPSARRWPRPQPASEARRRPLISTGHRSGPLEWLSAGGLTADPSVTATVLEGEYAAISPGPIYHPDGDDARRPPRERVLRPLAPDASPLRPAGAGAPFSSSAARDQGSLARRLRLPGVSDLPGPGAYSPLQPPSPVAVCPVKMRPRTTHNAIGSIYAQAETCSPGPAYNTREARVLDKLPAPAFTLGQRTAPRRRPPDEVLEGTKLVDFRTAYRDNYMVEYAALHRRHKELPPGLT